MLLSKLNSVGAIFISCPEAADVIRRIARRESVAKGRERFTLLLQPILPSLSRSSLTPHPVLLPVLHRLTHPSSLYTYARCLLSPRIPSPSYPPLLLPDVSSLVLAVKISSSVRHLRCSLHQCASQLLEDYSRATRAIIIHYCVDINANIVRGVLLRYKLLLRLIRIRVIRKISFYLISSFEIRFFLQAKKMNKKFVKHH